MMVLSACGGGQVAGGGQGNALPTVRPAEEVGSGAKSAARDTYQATWDSYLRDAIAAQNQLQDINNSMRQRYEKPSITAQNVGGLLKSVELVEDKTEWSTTGDSLAGAQAKFDVKLTFLNGDTDTRSCSIPVQVEKNADDNLWYVINPGPLAVLSICSR
jgi:hypothetical protein